MSNKIFTSPDKCGDCAQYMPKVQGCHRLSHGMSCVKDENVEDLTVFAKASVRANLAAAGAVLIDPATWPPLQPKKSALDVQVGGGHYKDMPIQPIEFITRNKIGFIEGCVIKRMCRWRNKAGIEDLRKAIHEIQVLIELEEKKNGS